MDASQPMTFTWDGEAMVPRHPKRADQVYCVGENYTLIPHEERSAKSHAHYFAAVHDMWQSLPESMGDQFPTAEHLRKYALIKSGYRDERSIMAASKAEAQRVAAFIRPMDEYAIVVVTGSMVVVYTAKSQSMRAMGKKDFQASKDAVLDVIAGLLGIGRQAA